MKDTLKELLYFLKNVDRDNDVIRHPYEVCIDCREIVKHGPGEVAKHEGHTIVMQDYDHGGVGEWIKCLRWVLEHG